MAIERLAYRVPEVGIALGISRAKAYDLIARGELPSIRVGSSIRVPVAALREWIARQEIADRQPIAA